MRAVYKNPRELATCLKDLVDSYLEELITYETLEAKVTRIITANEESFYKGGHIPVKFSNILGEERIEIINKIMNK